MQEDFKCRHIAISGLSVKECEGEVAPAITGASKDYLIAVVIMKKVLNRLEEELSTYIRFEKRILYWEISLAVSTEGFADIEKHH